MSRCAVVGDDVLARVEVSGERRQSVIIASGLDRNVFEQGRKY
jgi:hypothetical protein